MPSQLYMLLIIILILSQDKGFSQNIQEIMLGAVPWYRERLLQKTSLGDCLQTHGNWVEPNKQPLYAGLHLGVQCNVACLTRSRAKLHSLHVQQKWCAGAVKTARQVQQSNFLAAHTHTHMHLSSNTRVP